MFSVVPKGMTDARVREVLTAVLFLNVFDRDSTISLGFSVIKRRLRC